MLEKYELCPLELPAGRVTLERRELEPPEPTLVDFEASRPSVIVPVLINADWAK